MSVCVLGRVGCGGHRLAASVHIKTASLSKLFLGGDLQPTFMGQIRVRSSGERARVTNPFQAAA